MQTLSIITITYNSARYLEDAIGSVVAQTYPAIEFIVVDGGSNDGTLDIIGKYEEHIDRWISEPDEGISDAMNKGVALATGDFVYFLHSDDYLENADSVSEAFRNISEQNDIVLFGIFLEKAGAKELQRPRGFTAWMNFKTGVYHQSAICSRRLFDAIGGFDTELDIAMDYDFFLRAYRRGFNAVTIDMPLATMRLVGVSSQLDWESLRKRFGEERRIQLKYAASIGMRAVYLLYWSLYWPYRKLRFLLSRDAQ